LAPLEPSGARVVDQARPCRSALSTLSFCTAEIATAIVERMRHYDSHARRHLKQQARIGGCATPRGTLGFAVVWVAGAPACGGRSSSAGDAASVSSSGGAAEGASQGRAGGQRRVPSELGHYHSPQLLPIGINRGQQASLSYPSSKRLLARPLGVVNAFTVHAGFGADAYAR